MVITRTFILLLALLGEAVEEIIWIAIELLLLLLLLVLLCILARVRHANRLLLLLLHASTE